MSQTWTSEEIRELLEYTQALRKQNEDYKAMILASDAMIKNKESQIKYLQYEISRIRNTTELV